MNAADTPLVRPSTRIGWNAVPFFLVHLAAVGGVFLVELRWEHVALCIGLYYVRMFGITAGYHRYFSHRAYRTNRVFQFMLALIGTSAAQKGVLWWAAHHRSHHKYSDTERDLHSPVQRGFWWSHIGWFLSSAYDDTDFDRIKDFSKYPELVWLNKYWIVPPVLLAVAVFTIGGWGALIWGFFMSTVLLWHGTFFINSLAHVFGRRRYETTDTSRNSMLLALLTLGEGWHNNHHCYQSSANQGFFWWELDGSYYALRALSWLRVVTDLRKPPQRLLERAIDKLPTKLPSAEEVLAKLPSREEMAAQLAAARIALELFPERVRERLLHAEESLERLPDELLERLAAAGRALERLPEELRERLHDAERALERVPDEIRALLPSPEELLERLSLDSQRA